MKLVEVSQLASEFLCLPENLKACISPERTSLALQGNINFPLRLLEIFILKELNHFSFLPTGDL